jgi:hypothetical protein
VWPANKLVRQAARHAVQKQQNIVSPVNAMPG